MSEADSLSLHANVPLALAKLVVKMCTQAGYPVRTVRRDGKPQDLVDLRRQIAGYARTKGFSYPEIGRALNRDHTTILHGLRKIG